MKYVPSQGFPVRVGDSEGEVVLVVAKQTAESDRPTETQTLVDADGNSYQKIGPGVVKKLEAKEVKELDAANTPADPAVPGDGTTDASSSADADEMAEAEASAKPAAKAAKK